MNFNRVGLQVLALGLAAGTLSACGSGGDGGGDGTSLTYVSGVAGDNFFISAECAAKAEAKKLGYTLDVQAPQKWDASLQRPILDAAIAKQPDALIVTPNDVSALQKSLEQAKRDGIKIVLSDTTTEDPSVAESWVSADNVEVGRLGFEAIKQANPEGGKVLVINSSPGVSTGDDRGKGFTEAAESDPAFEFLGQQYAQDDNAKAAQLTSAALQADPDIVGIFATSGNETQGAATAVRQAGRTGEITVVGVDAYPAQVQALEAGDVQALIAQDVATIGTEMVRQAVNALEGKPVEKEILTSATILTAEMLGTPEGDAAVYKTSCS